MTQKWEVLDPRFYFGEYMTQKWEVLEELGTRDWGLRKDSYSLRRNP